MRGFIIVFVIHCFLSGASAAMAETMIKEYPDHVYVECDGNAGRRQVAEPPVDSTDQDTFKRRAELMAEMQMLQKESRELLKPVESDTPADTQYKRQMAVEKDAEVRRILKELSELKNEKTPPPSNSILQSR